MALALWGKVRYTKMMNMKKEKKQTTMKEDAGKVLIDMGKLLFGSFVLGGVLRGELPQYLILLSGLLGSGALIGIGLLWTAKEKRMKE
jgi:hypothetical protein